jgi:glycosyltransferase involved in cell wall biosynthesis
MTVLNGIDLEAFRQPKVTVCREDYGLKTKDFVLVFSGRVIPEKGIREVILAMNDLKEHRDIKLLIVGDSFYGNEDRKSPFIKELIKLSWDVRNQIVFTGFRPYEEIPALFSIADVAVLPSIWDEPFGLTHIEAMAAGLPIITTNNGGVPETVTPDCAIMLDVNEQLPQRIAEAVLDLKEHPEKRKMMQEMGRERSELFDKERYARYMLVSM